MDVNQQEVDSARPRVLLEWKDVKYSVGIKNKETKQTD
jgi:ABC-type multidrug transport system ATPase subunit